MNPVLNYLPNTETNPISAFFNEKLHAKTALSFLQRQIQDMIDCRAEFENIVTNNLIAQGFKLSTLETSTLINRALVTNETLPKVFHETRSKFHVLRQKVMDKFLELAQFFFPEVNYHNTLKQNALQRIILFSQIHTRLPIALFQHYSSVIQVGVKLTDAPFVEAYLTSAEAVTILEPSAPAEIIVICETLQNNFSCLCSLSSNEIVPYEDKYFEFKKALKDFMDSYLTIDEIETVKWEYHVSVFEKHLSAYWDYCSQIN